MSFEYPAGTLFTPATASQHASDILGRINAILSSKGILDSNGVIMQMAAVDSNAVWIMCLADGANLADLDSALLAAQKMFSVSECSDAQVSSCLPVAGTSLIPGAYSLLSLNVTADTSGATVNSGTKAPFGTVCNFVVVTTTAIPAGATVPILCQSDTIGPIEVAAHQITAFQTTIAHVTAVDNPSSAVPGRNLETYPQVRQRLLQGNIADVALDGAINAIKAIQGITDAKIWFNYDLVTTLNITGTSGVIVSVLPRQAYIIVAGVDETGAAIATAYAKRMNALTSGASHQTYTSLAGQSIPIYYDVAAAQQIYVKVYYDPNTVTATGFQTDIQTIVASTVWGIGKTVTAAAIDIALDGFQYALVKGSQVSWDNATWTNEVVVDANKYAQIQSANVTVTT